MADTLREFAGGTVGGWAQVLVGHPFDTIKVRIQTNNQYRNALHALTDTLKNEGPQALYKGVTSPIIGIGLVNAVIFSFYGKIRRLINPDYPNSPLTSAQTFYAGLATGTATAFVNAPVEHLKIRLQTQYGSRGSANTVNNGGVAPQTLRSLTAHLVRTRGVSSLFRGLGVTVVRDTPSFAFYFWSYEMVTKALETRAARVSGAPRELNVAELILAGGTAFQANYNYSSSLEVVRDVYARKGIGGFFKGVGPTLVRAFPANAATFLAYEMTMRRIAPGRHGRTYEIQRLLGARMTPKLGNVVGFKVGATTPGMQRHLHVSYPMPGVMHESRVFACESLDSECTTAVPLALSRASFNGPSVECEILVRLGPKPLDARGRWDPSVPDRRLTLEEVLASLEAVWTAAELVDDRYGGDIAGEDNWKRDGMQPVMTASDLEYVSSIRHQHSIHAANLSSLRATLAALPPAVRTARQYSTSPSAPTIGGKFTDLSLLARRRDLLQSISEAEERCELYASLVRDLGPVGGVDEVYLPVCVGVLSEGGWWDAMKDWVAGYVKGVKEKGWGVGIERLVSNLIHEIPSPPPGKFEVAFSPFPGLKVDLYVSRPPLNRGSAVKNFSLYPTLRHLSPPTLLLLLECLLLERRILLLSNIPSLLTHVASTLFLLMYPFRWDWPCFPLLPARLRDVLAAPVPWVAGMVKEGSDWERSNGKEEKLSKKPKWIFGEGEERVVPEEAIVVDLDSCTVHIHPAHPPVAHLPIRIRKKFLDTIARCAPIVCSSVNANTSVGSANSPLAQPSVPAFRLKAPLYMRELLPKGKFVPLSSRSVVKYREERMRAAQAARYLALDGVVRKGSYDEAKGLGLRQAGRSHSKAVSASLRQGSGSATTVENAAHGVFVTETATPKMRLPDGRAASIAITASAITPGSNATTLPSGSSSPATGSTPVVSSAGTCPSAISTPALSSIGVSPATGSAPSVSLSPSTYPRPPQTPPNPSSPNKRHRFSGSRLSLARQTSTGSLTPGVDTPSNGSSDRILDAARIRESTQVSGLVRETNSALFDFGEHVTLKLDLGLDPLREMQGGSGKSLTDESYLLNPGTSSLPWPSVTPEGDPRTIPSGQAPNPRGSVGGITLSEGSRTEALPTQSSPSSPNKGDAAWDLSPSTVKSSPSSAFDGIRILFQSPSTVESPERGSFRGLFAKSANLTVPDMQTDTASIASMSSVNTDASTLGKFASGASVSNLSVTSTDSAFSRFRRKVMNFGKFSRQDGETDGMRAPGMRMSQSLSVRDGAAGKSSMASRLSSLRSDSGEDPNPEETANRYSLSTDVTSVYRSHDGSLSSLRSGNSARDHEPTLGAALDRSTSLPRQVSTAREAVGHFLCQYDGVRGDGDLHMTGNELISSELKTKSQSPNSASATDPDSPATTVMKSLVTGWHKTVCELCYLPLAAGGTSSLQCEARFKEARIQDAALRIFTSLLKNYRAYLVRPAEERERSYSQKRNSLDYLSRAAATGPSDVDREFATVEYFKKHDFLESVEMDSTDPKFEIREIVRALSPDPEGIEADSKNVQQLGQILQELYIHNDVLMRLADDGLVDS
ncbi:hypothetical protein HDU93_004174 [Gonapodya sp. JEL0774]|nr:hypothetical protein HDU93_004174 [Gonapodya sp. JEL0774]